MRVATHPSQGFRITARSPGLSHVPEVARGVLFDRIMKLRELMKSPVTVDEDTPLGEVQARMRAQHVRHVPVVVDGELRGMISDRDIYCYRALMSNEIDWERSPAKWAMVTAMQVADPDDALADVAHRLSDAPLAAMPVVDHGKLVGLVTANDVIEAQVRAAMA
ncbi:MAG TPA: CBS domain-containing protein [Kofleriaceae bacterium]|nr:CBS domain-containing protein [Kofleriaceae bacterium]